MYHLPTTPVSQILIGSVYYYFEIGEGAEKLKSVTIKVIVGRLVVQKGTHCTHKASLSNLIHMD